MSLPIYKQGNTKAQKAERFGIWRGGQLDIQVFVGTHKDTLFPHYFVIGEKDGLIIPIQSDQLGQCIAFRVRFTGSAQSAWITAKWCLPDKRKNPFYWKGQYITCADGSESPNLLVPPFQQVLLSGQEALLHRFEKPGEPGYSTFMPFKLTDEGIRLPDGRFSDYMFTHCFCIFYRLQRNDGNFGLSIEPIVFRLQIDR